jgi:hypothetical protein
MTKPAPQPDMAWHLRRLLEAVKEAACGLEGRWGWLTAPMLLLTWMRKRRERKEAAEAVRAVQGLLEAFVGLLEDFRAGRLVAENAPEVEEEHDGTDSAVAHPSPRPPPSGPIAPARWEPGSRGGGEVRANGADGAVAPASPRLARSTAQSPVEGEREVGENGADDAVAHPSPSRCAGPSLSLRGRGIRRPLRFSAVIEPCDRTGRIDS